MRDTQQNQGFAQLLLEWDPLAAEGELGWLLTLPPPTLRRYFTGGGEGYYLLSQENPLRPRSHLTGFALSELEKERNTCHLEATTPTEAARRLLALLHLWESLLKAAFPQEKFFLEGEVDCGDVEEPSFAHAWFWAHRSGPDLTTDLHSHSKPMVRLETD